jgi:uncharacterized membrane protein
MINWMHAAPTILASFLASFVEFVEALTIVLAVGVVRGWRSALIGAVGGAAILAVLVLLLGSLITQVPIQYLQVVIGVLLLLFGMRWLRKAILRAAGIIPLHDEAAAFEAETTGLKRAGGTTQADVTTWGGFDYVAGITALKAVLLEGLEVVFIVVATGGAGGLLLPASLGAVIAGVIVILLGIALHRPLALVPENTLKFAVGVLLSTFGIFWVGEGLGYPWPGADLSILMIGIFILAAAAISAGWARTRSRQLLLEKAS